MPIYTQSSSTLFPYTTLFRSEVDVDRIERESVVHVERREVEDVLLPLLQPEDRGPLERHGRQVDVRARRRRDDRDAARSEEHTSELQSRLHLVCRLLLEKKKH